MTVDTDALISCVVDGQPEPTVSWRFAGSRINFSEFRLFLKGNNFTAVISCWTNFTVRNLGGCLAIKQFCVRDSQALHG